MIKLWEILNLLSCITVAKCTINSFYNLQSFRIKSKQKKIIVNGCYKGERNTEDNLWQLFAWLSKLAK